MGVIQEKVSLEKTVAYSAGHSAPSSSTNASYALVLFGQNHSNRNANVDSPTPTV